MLAQQTVLCGCYASTQKDHPKRGPREKGMTCRWGSRASAAPPHLLTHDAQCTLSPVSSGELSLFNPHDCLPCSHEPVRSPPGTQPQPWPTRDSMSPALPFAAGQLGNHRQPLHLLPMPWKAAKYSKERQSQIQFNTTQMENCWILPLGKLAQCVCGGSVALASSWPEARRRAATCMRRLARRGRV